MKKGDFGYIKSNIKKSRLRTAILGSVCAFFFLFGYFHFGTNKNFLTIISTVLCIPLGLSLVNHIMFLRAKPCSKEAYKKIEEHRAGLIVNYDLFITSEKKDYSVSSIATLDKRIIAFVEDEKVDTEALELHIKRQIALSKYHDFMINISKNLDEYILLIDELNNIRIEKNIDPIQIEKDWEIGTVQTVNGVLLSISL